MSRFNYGTFEEDGDCKPCPNTGVECNDGLIKALPGFWTPAQLDTIADSTFSSSTNIFRCLTKHNTSCLAASRHNATVRITPATAYTCAKGHTGVLCAACDDGFYFKTKRCLRCNETVMSPRLVTVLIVVSSLAALYVAFRLVLRTIADKVIKTLHLMRKRLRRKRRDKRIKRTSSMSSLAAFLGKTSVQIVRRNVKSASEHIIDHSETFRIVLGACKVLTHLYGTLSWCLFLPDAMDGLMAVASLLIFDVFEDKN